MKILIDGIEIEAQPGETILEAAKRTGIHIPTCATMKLLAVRAVVGFVWWK